MKMIIVDDELGVAESVKIIYDWTEFGIDDVFVYVSAKEALEKLKERERYILITDIMMPDIDGLELTKTAIEMNPDIQVIIFSGYDDFMYAQKAMRAGAIEYLLKPVSLEEIISAVRRAAQNISSKTDISEYDRQNEKNMYSNLLINESMRLPDERFRDYTELIKFNGTVKWGVCFCVKIIECKNQSSWDIEKDLPILYVAVDNVLNELLAGRGNSFNNNTGTVIAFLFGTETYDHMEIIADCKSILEETLDISVAVGVGTAEKFNGTLCEDYKNALQACEHFAYYQKSEILKFEDLRFRYDYPQNTENMLLSETDKGENASTERFNEIIDAYFVDMRKKADIPTYYFEKICDEMIFVCFKKMESLGFEISSELKQNIKQKRNNISDLKSGFEECFKIIAEILKHENKDKQDIMIEKVKYYIAQNLDSDLSLKTVSKQFHFSTRYFAHVFKLCTDSNYTQYVNSVRMEEAKRLLRMSNLNINEIARRVGYSDVGHFSRNFKSIVGKRPSEYRRDKL